MCARYTLTKKPKVIRNAYELESPEEFKPNYNVAPTHAMPVITADEPGKIQLMHFGLVPHWAKDLKVGYSMLNARQETLLEKPSFKPLLVKNKRCLILADGFYEWKTVGKEKLPFRFTLKDRDTFSFAGLWSQWLNPADGKPYRSFSIVTTVPNHTVSELHDRMPVILSEESEKYWLSEDIKPEELIGQTCIPYPDDLMRKYRVSVDVNKVANNNPELILESKD